jgi:Ca-activated chloride channel homolog
VIGFIWPVQLIVLLVIPLLAFLYRRSVHRPAEAVVYHPDAEFLSAVSKSRFSLRRELPVVLYLVAVGLGVTALARPTAPIPVPDNRTTIMLALDVSLSMEADDIKPTRFEAAKDAAKVFIKQLPAGTKIGLASFAGFAAVNVSPTADHDEILKAIDELSLGRGTAIGAGLLEAVRALPDRATETLPKNPAPAAIVLLTDGRNNRPPEPEEGAAEARAKQVPVYTVGLGTENGVINFEGNQTMMVGFDPETLRNISSTTGGQYFEARSAGQLTSIYARLGRQIGWTSKPGEVTGVVAAIAGLLLFAAIAVGERSRRVI